MSDMRARAEGWQPSARQRERDAIRRRAARAQGLPRLGRRGRLVAQGARGPVAQRPGARGRERRDLLLRAPARDLPHAARARVLPAAGRRDRLRRPVPGPASAARAARGRLRYPGPTHPRHDDLAGRARRARDRADVLGLRRRGVPRGHRVGAALAGRRGPIARAHSRAGDPARRAAPGGAPRRAAPAQRTRRAVEGLGPHLDPRGVRRDPRGPGRDLSARELHALHRRGLPVHPPDDPPDASHRRVRAPLGLARGAGRHRGRRCAAVTSADDGAPLLRVRGVRKAFGDNVVLDGIDLDVRAHQVIALIGASGSGKSTLLRTINLLEEVDDGDIWLDGQDICDPRVDANAVRARMGMVFQSYNLFGHLRVLENVALAQRLVHKVARPEAEAKALAMLERVGLADKARSFPDELSGGQQQRVAIARALVSSPRLLLLDEVTSALDPELVGEVLDLLTELRGEGFTMLIATHEMAFARDVADEVCFLHHGRIHEQGPAAQVLTEPREARTREFLRRMLPR